MQLLRTLCLVLLLSGLAWFQFGQPLSAKALAQRAEDAFEPRPARRILILGNSRTFYHDMPDMIRAMADSAKDPQKYQITVEALPGASFESLWGDPNTRSLLGERWDDAILQSESRAQATDELDRSFLTYGEHLVRAVRLKSGAPRLVVNWNYGAELYDDGDPDGSGRAAYYAAIQSDTELLGNRTGAKLVNIGQLWAQVANAYPKIRLTEDGNHPTPAGSYLFALLLYADLSHRDVSLVTYAPMGVDPASVIKLREAAQAFQAVAL